jgi:hypothetical protein
MIQIISFPGAANVLTESKMEPIYLQDKWRTSRLAFMEICNSWAMDRQVLQRNYYNT